MTGGAPVPERNGDPPPPDAFRVVTWNLFHCRDGHPGARATWASRLRGRPVVVDDHVHLNRKLTRPMAALLSRHADLCLLQEVPPLELEPLARAAGMRAAWKADTGPLVGPVAIRGRIGRLNPDLAQTHEGNANAILVGPRIAPVPGSARALRLNPWPVIARRWRDGGLEHGAALLWLSEARRALACRVRAPGGAPVTVVCVHLHNARHLTESITETTALARALRAVDGPLILGGDVNVPPGHPALEPLAELGLADPSEDPRMGIDRILVRGLQVVRPARRWEPAERDAPVVGPARTRGRVRLSDHDPVEVMLRAWPRGVT